MYEDCIELSAKKTTVIRHSEYGVSKQIAKQQVNVILGDSMGEMQMWYALADIVFIGGSLVKVGGHNPLEATVLGKPVVSGPHMFNFEDMTENLHSSGLLMTGKDDEDVSCKILELLSIVDQEKRTRSSNIYKVKADAFIEQHQGATERVLTIISSVMKQ